MLDGGQLPLKARAQQRAMPVIGYIGGRTADSDASMLVAVRRGLADVGYAEGRNVAIEYRFADWRYDRISPTASGTGSSITLGSSETLVMSCCGARRAHSASR